MNENPWDDCDDDGRWLEPFDVTPEPPVEWVAVESFSTPEYFLFKKLAESEKLDASPPMPDLRRSIYVFSDGWTDRLC